MSFYTFKYALDTYFRRENNKQIGNLRREKDASQLSATSKYDIILCLYIDIDVIHSTHKNNEEKNTNFQFFLNEIWELKLNVVSVMRLNRPIPWQMP